MGKLKNSGGTPATVPPSYQLPPSIPVNTAPPAPFEFAPRPATVMAYQTPPREIGSGTGAQNAFASQQPPGFNPVQALLASLPPLGSTTPPPSPVQYPPAQAAPTIGLPTQQAPIPVQAPQSTLPAQGRPLDIFRTAIRQKFG
jgi:hypothetical protein